MSKFTSRADLLIAAGESIKMQEKAGAPPQLKYMGKIKSILSCTLDYTTEHYEFPLAVIEGKPVFVGDELYSSGCTKPSKMIIENCDGMNLYGSGCCIALSFMSWLPPKPKTVMVELLREDAERFSIGTQKGIFDIFSTTDRIGYACRKALEKA